MPTGDNHPIAGTIGLGAVDRNGRRASSDRAEKAKAQALMLIRKGYDYKEAMREVGRQPNTWFQWMNASPKFRDQAIAAKAAWDRQQSKASLTWRQRQDEFEPIMLADYKNRVEYWVAFRKAYFGFDTFDHQWQILEAWDAVPPGGISMVLVPPEAGKSTLLCDTVTADLCDDANRRRAIVSEGKDLASKMMGRVARRLEESGGPPSVLQEHFGPFQPGPGDSRKWNATEFTLLASDHDEADPSFLCVGAGSNIRGSRWDDVDLDDIQSIKSKNKTGTLLEIFRGDIIPRVKRGRIRITGSRVCKGDFYDEGERLELFDEIIVIPALDVKKDLGFQSYFPLQFRTEVVDEREIEVPILDEHGEQLGFSDAELLQRAGKLGDDLWSRIYMMKPQSDHESLVTDEDILAATDHGQPGHPKRYIGNHPAGSVGTIASMDPSLHKHAALGVDGYDAEFMYVITTVDLFKATTNQRIFAEMRALTKKFLPTWWVIENNTLQSGYLTDDPFLDLIAEFGFSAVGHHTGDKKTNEFLGVPAMMAAICRGEIRFPMIQDPDSKEGRDLAKMFQQLKDWRQDIPTKRLEQDQVMRLWFAYLLWKKLREQVEVDTSQWKRDGLTQVSGYPYAKTNVMPSKVGTAVKEHKTYDQAWAELTESK